MLVAENRQDTFRALLRQREVVHENPNQHERQHGRDCPRVAHRLDIDFLPRLDVDKRVAEQPAEAHTQQDWRSQVNQRDTEVADARVYAEREPLIFFREKESDVRHGRREITARHAD